MQSPQKADKTGGFALLVVLAVLAVLTTLYGIFTVSAINSAFNSATRQLVVERTQSNIAALEVAAGLPTSAEVVLAESEPWATYRYASSTWDARGLLDANSTAPQVLEAYLFGPTASLNLPPRLERLFDFRQAGNRFYRMHEARALLEIDPVSWGGLEPFFTLLSGQSFPQLRLSPPELLDIVECGMVEGLFCGGAASGSVAIIACPSIETCRRGSVFRPISSPKGSILAVSAF